MQNDYIIPTGIPSDPYQEDEKLQEPSKYLEVDKKLKEIADNNYQEQARGYLGVPSKEELTNLINRLSELQSSLTTIKEQVDDYSENSVNSISDIKDELSSFVKIDGSRPFENIPLVNDQALITEQKVNKKLESYTTESKVASLISNALRILDQYAPKNSVYDTEHSYCKKAIDKKLNDEYVSKTDLISRDYANNYQLKRKINEHNQEYNAHNFENKIKDELRNYYKKGEVWPRSCTYSRAEINSIVDKLVDDAYEDLIQKHLNITQHLDAFEVQNIVAEYAKIHLVNNKALEDTILSVQEECEKHKPIWKTSGPVLTTVGFVEDETTLPAELTLQQILDRIFYGPRISISADETSNPFEMVDVTMCLHPGLPVKSITLYANGVEIDSFVEEEFADGCITRSYGPILEDTEFTFTIVYDDPDNTELSDSTTVSVQCPIFVGIIPKMKAQDTITMKYLKDLIKHDPNNNEFTNSLPVIHEYNFKDPKLQKLIVGIPTSYNKELDNMTNGIQKFNKEAFDFHKIELVFSNENPSIENVNQYYDFYTYNQPLSSLNSEVIFNFA